MSYVNTGSFLAVGVTFAVLGISAVGARFFVRSKNVGLGVEDWCCFAALVRPSRKYDRFTAQDEIDSRARRMQHHDCW